MDHVNNAVYADWLEEAVMAAGGGADVALDPARGASRLCAGGGGRRDRRGNDVAGSRWSWSCRVADADGADLLRARLEAGPIG